MRVVAFFSALVVIVTAILSTIGFPVSYSFDPATTEPARKNRTGGLSGFPA